MPARSKADQQVELKPLKIETVKLHIVGDTELIMHKWSEKAKRMILDKHMGKTREKKEPKNPEQEYESTIYRMDDGSIGFPVGGFKAAIVGGCRLFDAMPMTQAKIAVFVIGDGMAEGDQMVRIEGAPRMREDMTRNETGVVDIRYRAGFFPWSATLTVRYNASILSLEQLVNLVNAAGYGGIGDWRPSAPKSSSGDYGRFHVEG